MAVGAKSCAHIQDNKQCCKPKQVKCFDLLRRVCILDDISNCSFIFIFGICVELIVDWPLSRGLRFGFRNVGSGLP